jgi:hypothetical protein
MTMGMAGVMNMSPLDERALELGYYLLDHSTTSVNLVLSLASNFSIVFPCN